MGFQDLAFLPSQASFPPYFLNLWYGVFRSSALPQLCKLWFGVIIRHAVCRTFYSKNLHDSQLLWAPTPP